MTEKCNDKNCPEHGSLVTKGSTFVGTVVSDKMHKTVTVQWKRRIYVPKYERYLQKWSKVKAHNPDCINAEVGDYVEIKEVRPLSKTKNFVVTKKLGKKEIVTIDHEELLSKKERSKKSKDKETVKSEATEE